MALSDTYHDFAWAFKDESETYLDPDFYTEDQIRRAKLVFQLLKNEGGFIDIGHHQEGRKELIIEQNEILESLKRE